MLQIIATLNSFFSKIMPLFDVSLPGPSPKQNEQAIMHLLCATFGGFATVNLFFPCG
jgi:hypothetical protein